MHDEAKFSGNEYHGYATKSAKYTGKEFMAQFVACHTLKVVHQGKAALRLDAQRILYLLGGSGLSRIVECAEGSTFLCLAEEPKSVIVKRCIFINLVDKAHNAYSEFISCAGQLFPASLGTLVWTEPDAQSSARYTRLGSCSEADAPSPPEKQ
jgi:hypothetical protein